MKNKVKISDSFINLHNIKLLLKIFNLLFFFQVFAQNYTSSTAKENRIKLKIDQDYFCMTHHSSIYFFDIYNINCDRILDKDLDNIPEFFINSSVICTFVYLYNCTLLENLPTLTISESHPLKNYLPTCSYFKSLFKIYSLKKHFLKELFLKIHIF